LVWNGAVKQVLDGIRILAVEQFGAGPYGTLHLADLGAEVIKIENRGQGGDVARSVPPFAGQADSLYFQSMNRNKRSLTLNLKHPDGKRVFHDLVRVSDAVFTSLRGDQPKVLGLLYDDLKAYNPAIVCCHLTGFGLDGPRHAEPAYDYLMQAYAGWMSLTGDPDAPPTKSGLSVVDFSAGLAAMAGLLAGLLDARRSGFGRDVDVSLLDTAVSMLNYQAIWMLNRDYTPQRLADSAHPSIVPSQVFATSDGHIVVFCAKEKFWQLLAEALGADELLEDPRFSRFSDRLEHRAELVALLRPLFAAHTTDELLARLRGNVPCAPVNDIRQALEDEQVRAREMVIEVEHPEFGPLRQTATAIKTTGEAIADLPGPALGVDNEAILRDLLGYDEFEIERLRESGAI
jgi:crotonobetainyl-CoA:carnitine CoA-transferase CaiB-like acyl-CoA transferase